MTEETTREAPTPGDMLVDESGVTNTWLQTSYTIKDIADEWEHLFAEGKPVAEQLHEIWYRPRWTTPEELADEDLLYDIFGDWELNGVDTSVVYEQAKPDTPGAYRYWTVD